MPVFYDALLPLRARRRLPDSSRQWLWPPADARPGQAPGRPTAQALPASRKSRTPTRTSTLARRLAASAPDLTLTNQFGQKISLSAFRGKVIILAFTDSECTTVCPLTTESMLAAMQLLGEARPAVRFS